MKLNIKNIKKFYIGYGGLSSHGFDHVERVLRMAKLISKKEGGDMETIEAAALLHDMGRTKEDKNERLDHAAEGAKMARVYLGKINFPKNKIGNVIHCIAVHRFSRGKKPETIEAEIIQDADRLDALGAIIITRVLSHGALHGLPVYDPRIKPLKKYTGKKATAINHFYEKILKITPSSFYTKTAQKIARQRYDFVVKFLDQFKKEWNGEDL
ncbi:MAG: hypothetical protein A2654_01055 [Candidatus Nealsonbacteria bacterium RIFCSPHIGHO2_01_FULL_43_31]|uniref:HD domain-containing protein n=2 Tax=Candidatus Nealsoniibacteriota TaxID=1817911 RepID=A0A1G2E940_9BACT|nr:MAG: hypothetical protein A2654_01055 [Candidatus Nealsonbacteria bacterium RIFCSPHIGHO2_01_FULL_43_31]OGZ22325.1 MAG: hypothetical protein A3D46_00450 [Candidatus Nealsonbacteria bacterium RIFCSPHIGHO2_02_FULL_43_13]